MREQKRQIEDQELRLPERPAEVEPPAAKLPSRRGDLSLEQIKEWVDAYRVKNDGKFPSQETGPVVNADGTASGETWAGIDQLLRAGHEGQRARRFQHTGFSSLADFLNKTYSAERRAIVERRLLSLEQIREWVDAYRAKNDGKFPSASPVSIVNPDGSATKETWAGINHLLATGQRGRLARGLQNTGFSSLSDFLDKSYPGDRDVRGEKEDLSLEKIKEWVDAYRVQNGGNFPTLRAGLVVNADGSATGETWIGLDSLFRSAQRGLPARGLQHTVFSSLADFLDKTYPVERKRELSLEQIKEWVDAYRVKNDGKFPSQETGPVVNPDGSATVETWTGIDQLLRTGHEGQRARGLQHTGFSSLADFLDKTYSRDREVKGDLSLAQIKEWVDAYRAMNDGKFPSVHTGPVINADGSATGETWNGINRLLRIGKEGQPARGLQDTGASSLADFLDKTYLAHRAERRELSLEQIKEWVDVYRAMNDGKFPSVNTGPVVNADGSATKETWAGINNLLAAGQRGRLARGLQDTGFSSLADFLDRTYPTERKQELSIDRVKEWVDAYRGMNGGRFPTKVAGSVVNGDGSATGETWSGLDSLFKSAQRGPPARGLQHTVFSSLADFLDKTYPGERTANSKECTVRPTSDDINVLLDLLE